VIATSTVKENLQILNEVYDVLNKNKLTLRLDKCSLLQTKITYFGYDISENGIQPNEQNKNAISSYPVPTNLKALQRFLGLAL